MRVRVNVDIHRPVETVFEYLVDPATCVDWLKGFSESIPTQSGSLRVGTQLHQTVRFLRRNFKIVSEVVELVPNEVITMRVLNGPFPMTWRHELGELGRETRVTTTLEAEPGGYFRVAGLALRAVVTRHLAEDHEQLKARLDAQVAL
jgi:uncharacterized protein YndB with AHSA1/START domain